MIDVIMPAFNMEVCIAKAIDSLLKQTYKDIHLIVIDDCSTDRTVEIVNSYKDKLDITCIENEKQIGSGESRNIAFKKLKGEFFTFLDADDYFCEVDYLEKMLAKQQETDADIVYSGYSKEFKDKFNEITPHRFITEPNDAVKSYLNFKFGTHAAWAKLYSKEIAEKSYFGKFGFSIDVIFVLNSLKNAKKIAYCDSKGYVYSRIIKSIWNTTEFTIEHFYSSFRLLAEIYTFVKGTEIPLKEFENIWCRNHYPRIVKFLRSKNLYDSIPVVSKILGTIAPIQDKILPLIKNNIVKVIIDKLSFTDNFNATIDPKYLNYITYLQEIIAKYESDLIEEHTDKNIVIYVSHISSGGLERMAIRYADVLEDLGYKINIIIDTVKEASFVTHHKVILFKKQLSEEILSLVYNCDYFIDFKYKKPSQEFPLIKFVIQRFPYKYIPTIHNTETCSNYVDKIVSYSVSKPFDNFYAAICVSEAVKQSVIDRFKGCNSQKLIVLNNYADVDLSNINTNNQFGSKYMLFAGRLDATYHKGLDILIEAYSQSATPLKLVLVGANSLSADIKEMIHSSKRAKDIIVKGFTDDIYSLMSFAEFLVVSSRHEGNQLAVIEALECGLPVLSTKVGASPQIIKDGINGYLVDSEDVVNLAKGMDLLTEQAAKLKPNCKESISLFSKESFKKNLKNILNSKYIPGKGADAMMIASHFCNTTSFINLKETGAIYVSNISNVASKKGNKWLKLLKKVLKKLRF